MRICEVVNAGFVAGGAERSVKLIAEGMRDRGHEVLVVATDVRLREDDIAESDLFADVLIPAVGRSLSQRLTGYFWNRRAYREIRSVLDTFKPDLVHFHTIGEFSPSVLAASSRVPRVMTVHGPEDWTLRLLKWHLLSSANPNLSRFLRLRDWAQLYYFRLIQRPAYLPWIRRLDLILTPSAFMAESIRPDIGRVQIQVLPHGTVLMKPSPIRGAGNLLFVGRLEPVKGANVLIRAFDIAASNQPDAHLVIVGEGSQRKELEDLAHALGRADRITFTGWLSSDQLRSRYDECAVVAIPSIWPENFPMVALEALAVGRPILATRVGGMAELVSDQENGLLVEPNDVAALADAIGTMLADRGLMQRMALRSAGRADQYDPDHFLNQLEGIYESLVCADETRSSR